MNLPRIEALDLRDIIHTAKGSLLRQCFHTSEYLDWSIIGWQKTGEHDYASIKDEPEWNWPVFPGRVQAFIDGKFYIECKGDGYYGPGSPGLDVTLTRLKGDKIVYAVYADVAKFQRQMDAVTDIINRRKPEWR